MEFGTATLVNGEVEILNSNITNSSLVFVSRRTQSFDYLTVPTMGQLTAPMDIVENESFKIKSDNFEDCSEVQWFMTQS